MILTREVSILIEVLSKGAGRKGRAYRRFVFVELDSEEGRGRAQCRGCVSGWDAPAYRVDVVEAVYHIFCLYQLCVVHPAVLILPTLFNRKRAHREKQADFCLNPLDKGSTQQWSLQLCFWSPFLTFLIGIQTRVNSQLSPQWRR